MKEIKLRAWDKNNKKIVYPRRLFQFVSEMYKPDRIYAREVEDKDGIVYSVTRNQLTFLLYTGLKDKNGKEIYEGDIIRRDGLLYFVFYDDENAMFRALGTNVGSNVANELMLDQIGVVDAIIVGNIYENPELRGADKDERD